MPAPIRLAASLLCAAPIFRGAYRDLRRSGLSSKVLEALAVGISMARQDFAAANAATAMLALGEYLEDSVARRSDELLRGLLQPPASEVWVDRGGVEQQVPVASLQVGDTVVLGAGVVVPIDGTVLSGEATLTEVAMTGESEPVVKRRGDAVLSGTVVEEGLIRVYAERVGESTAASRIGEYVERSLSSKSQLQLQSSRMADRLVPVVFGLASASYAATGDWRRVASVLQADYSCVLKLATPVAFKSSMFLAAKRGVLVKGASALERLAEADTFVFDKTGTLTEGQLAVTDAITLTSHFTASELLALAASLEEHHAHPLAEAVVSAARGTGLRHFDHSDVEFIVAHGVASEVDGKRVVVGSRHFVEDDERIPVSHQTDRILQFHAEGKTVLFIGYDGRLVGLIALQDRNRDNGRRTLRRLRHLGASRLLLLSGDSQARADVLGRELGLDEYHGELFPADKARIVEELSAKGAKIAFVGDGINDAPALAGAHVGIAMGRGADLARLSADVVLLDDDVERVADAKALAHQTLRLVRQNYGLAVLLNTGVLGAAALGISSPVTTATLHNGSTLAILGNALRGRAGSA